MLELLRESTTHARAALQHTSSSEFVIVDLRRERQSSWVARDPEELQIVWVCRTRPPTRVYSSTTWSLLRMLELLSISRESTAHARAALQYTSSSKFVIVDLTRERQSSWVARDPEKLQIVRVCGTRPPTRVVVPHEVYCACWAALGSLLCMLDLLYSKFLAQN